MLKFERFLRCGQEGGRGWGRGSKKRAWERVGEEREGQGEEKGKGSKWREDKKTLLKALCRQMLSQISNFYIKI